MKPRVLLAAACLIAFCTCITRSAPPGTDAATPPRLPDGRVSPTIRPLAGKYAWKTDAQRLAVLQRTNKLRNELLAKFPLPLAVARRVADGTIKIDGKLDEQAWKDAPVILVDHDNYGKPVTSPTRFRLLWDSTYLYIAAECEDHDIIATLKDHDAELWREDAVEVFINPNGDEQAYLELEISPAGVWYDASIADYRPEVDWDVGGNHLDVDQSVTRYDTRDSKWATTVDGALNGHTGHDKGWTAEMAIAWTDMARGANVTHAHPEDGDVLRINLYRINVDKIPKETAEYAAWNPTGTWFHRPWLFGRVVLVK